MRRTTRRLSRPARLAPHGIAATLVLSATLAACISQPPASRYAYRPEHGFVRIESIEAGARDNAHPAAVSGEALRAVLENLKVKGTSLHPVAVFDKEELVEFVPPMASALRNAGPQEDVTFAVAGQRGLFGRFSGTTFTTGRLYVRDGEINVIFGQMHERYEDRNGATPVQVPFEIGSRERRIEDTWQLQTSGACVVQRRGDWIAADAGCLRDASSAIPTSAPTADGDAIRVQEVEARLRLLDQLKQRGAITEEEYRERRKAILEGI